MPLSYTVFRGHISTIPALLDYGVDIVTRGTWCYMALPRVAMEGNEDDITVAT